MPMEKDCGFHLEADFVDFIVQVQTIAPIFQPAYRCASTVERCSGTTEAQTADKWVFAFVWDICEYHTVEQQLQLHMLC